MTSQETFNDIGCSSSEEDSNRSDLAEGTAEEKTSPVVPRHHPFSVEALMSGRKTDGRGGEFIRCKPERSSVAASPTGLNSLYLDREACSPPGGSRKSLTAVPLSPVKSEASESEDCVPWVTKSVFSTQPRLHNGFTLPLSLGAMSLYGQSYAAYQHHHRHILPFSPVGMYATPLGYSMYHLS
ncbi:hypothetical protein FQN60_000579 [Etheostoma spectabile]|uniref:Uncharacterized protein n=1 Tax=Etheostoma spectabile TaxID=54343 RepID=A0A5J5D0R8_9PERO|nr:hypothetical protein FQN60_000579 [Etheostoma spectabile]